MTSRPHPLATMLVDAAEGSFPPADGTVLVLPPAHDVHAIVAFSAHSVLLTDRTPAEVAARGIDAYGGSMEPANQLWLAGDRSIGSIDVVMARRAGGTTALRPTTTLADHPRVVRSLAHRRDVDVLADEHGLVTIGRGLVDRYELSVELFDGAMHSRGAGRTLIAAGLAAVPEGEWVWAQVAAGNAASIRAFLGSGFVPVCSEVLLTHHD